MNMEAGGKKLAMGGDELLEAQSHIWNHIFNFINSMSLKCAIQLGIPDAIHSHGPNPMPLSLLVSSLQLHPNKTQFIYRLMRLLTHSGFFVLQEEGYLLTNSSRLLLKDNPCAVSPFLLSMLQPALTDPFQFLSIWLQTDDRTPFETAHGMPFWEYMGNKAKDGEVFNEGMASDARLVMSVILEKHKSVFEGVESLVDVGGGTGTMAKAISQAFPQMECTVFDLPQVVAHLKEDQPNFKYVEGDMFKLIPPADVLLLKWILHDWSDEECVEILKNCKAAITSNGDRGKVMVIDIVLFGNKKDPMETQLLFDMLMMTLAGGKEREEEKWAELIKEAGFRSYKIFPIMGVRSLIEIYP
ncbi:trans-resveratrol di-O-methyltransferase-like [Cucumis melo var. makuwa]|uniref:Trans-resveratrol di-O-methyltransferase-like n=1 Tax=Cucumis melo var. makuwa TaxID=1194695 RepID=A0A5D3DDN8_CUCMM|nr:trans-resveratrol di-O-methyltransferase-like [Cucumis melo var. makuwa]